MASILRQIVAGPRARHPEAGLDLCYVTDNILVTSGPSSVWPRKAYRNPIDQLVRFLDTKHGKDWAIFEFRAEGTGYPDTEVYGRIHHFPWPDHHPPPFAIIPNLMAAMRNWIQNEPSADEITETEVKSRRFAVVHCKAGKGRSGTAACSYLISEEGWKMEDALQRFTDRRMRTGFGQGVSIPSQLRYVRYVNRWTNDLGKKYVERPIEIVEVHIWGLRDGVKVAVEGYLDGGKRIHLFHTFNREEKKVIDQGRVPTDHAPMKSSDIRKDNEYITSPLDGPSSSSQSNFNFKSDYSGTFQTVILTPSSPLILPSSDINIDFERRNKASYAGFTMVTAVAHVWFNTFFEGGAEGHESGVFEIQWDAMDGIKGSARKGTRAFEKLKVVWKNAETDSKGPATIEEPKKGEPVPEIQPADWKGEKDGDKEAEAKHSDGWDSSRQGGTALTMGTMIQEGASSLGKELGLRHSKVDSANISRASSVQEASPPRRSNENQAAEDESDDEGVQSHVVDDVNEDTSKQAIPETEAKQDTKVGHYMEAGLARAATIISKMKGGDKKTKPDDNPVNSPTIDTKSVSNDQHSQLAPKVDAPNADVPSAETPKTDTLKVEAPENQSRTITTEPGTHQPPT